MPCFSAFCALSHAAIAPACEGTKNDALTIQRKTENCKNYNAISHDLNRSLATGLNLSGDRGLGKTDLFSDARWGAHGHKFLSR